MLGVNVIPLINPLIAKCRVNTSWKHVSVEAKPEVSEIEKWLHIYFLIRTR